MELLFDTHIFVRASNSNLNFSNDSKNAIDYSSTQPYLTTSANLSEIEHWAWKQDRVIGELVRLSTEDEKETQKIKLKPLETIKKIESVVQINTWDRSLYYELASALGDEVSLLVFVKELRLLRSNLKHYSEVLKTKCITNTYFYDVIRKFIQDIKGPLQQNDILDCQMLSQSIAYSFGEFQNCRPTQECVCLVTNDELLLSIRIKIYGMIKSVYPIAAECYVPSSKKVPFQVCSIRELKRLVNTSA